jgi:phosphohistidine phosphatase SixA
MRLLAFITVLMLCAPAAEASDALWTKLREGGRVALIRHAQAPGGAGDPAGYRLDDCATQRNLSEKGRTDARALGEQIRAQGVPVGKVLTSEWCRCRETARLLDLGPVEDAPTFNNAYNLRDQRERLTDGARAVIGAWSGPGTLIVVTHGANILPLTGIQPGEGEIVVVEPDRDSPSRLKVLGRIALAP